MLFKSPSHAKALLILCLLIGSTSVHFGTTWNEKAQALRSSRTKAIADTEKAKSTLEQLQQSLEADKQQNTLDVALSGLLLDVFNRRVAHGISVATATPSKLGGSSMSQVSSLAEAVPNSTLHSVKVNITGTYETYPGLMAYLAELQKHPAALVRLKVQEQSFEVSLRVYGALEPA